MSRMSPSPQSELLSLGGLLELRLEADATLHVARLLIGYGADGWETSVLLSAADLRKLGNRAFDLAREIDQLVKR